MGITIKSRKNLLDMIPSKNPRYSWEESKNNKNKGMVRITMPRDSLIERIVRVFAHTPESLTIKLDAYGSYVWLLINDKQNIYEIGLLLKAQFGEDAEPLYERLGGFMNKLKNNGLISYRFPK